MSRQINRVHALSLTGALAALGLVLTAAAPAEAGRFGDGFEDELGRIAAHAAVGAGFHLLHHVTAPHYVETHVVHGPRHYGPRPHYRSHRHDHKHHYRKHHYRGHHGKHHYRHRGRHYERGHWRGIPPCEVEHRVSVRERYSRY